MNPYAKNTLCLAQILSLALLPAQHRPALADEISQAASLGNSAGDELSRQAGADDLAAFAGREGEIFSSGDGAYRLPSMEDDTALERQAAELKSHLASDPEDETGGAYFVVKTTRLNRTWADLARDKSLTSVAREVFAGSGQEENELLGDCSRQILTSGKNSVYHVPDLRDCTRITEHAGECQLLHQLYLEPVVGLLSSGLAEQDNSLNIAPCQGEDHCLAVFAGKQYTNNRGRCLEYDDRLKVAVYHPEAIRKVVLGRVAWDDFWGSWITGADGVRHPLALPTAELPLYVTDPERTDNPEAWAWIGSQGWAVVDRLDGDRVVNGIGCENNWHGSSENCRGGGRCNQGWDMNADRSADGTDLTSIFRGASADSPVVIDSVTSTEDDGQYQLQLKIYYDPSRVVIRESWESQACLASVASISDGFAPGSVRCLETLPNVSSAEDGNLILSDWGIAAGIGAADVPSGLVERSCRRAMVKVEGVYTPDGGGKGDCGRYENQCAFVSAKCADEGRSGNCYLTDEVYDCGTDVESEERVARTSYSCSGQIRCLGTECAGGERNVSRGFARASALLQASDFMAQDMQCSGLDANGSPTGREDVICRIFSGRARSCTQALKGAGGLEVDCCDSPGGVPLAGYIGGILMISRLDGVIAGMDHASSIYGAYSELRRPVFNAVSEIGNGLSQVTQPFASWFENATGMKGLFSSDKSIVDYVTDKLKAKAREILQKIFARAQDNLAAEGAAAGGGGGEAGSWGSQEAANAVVENLSSALSVVGYVYMVYQISCMVSAMLFKCTPDQLELAASRSLKNCSYVGQYCRRKVLGRCVARSHSYCCFSSPLSRIVQEQVRLQLGEPFSSMDPKAPDCGGFSVEEMNRIRWEDISLDEWTALLKMTGNYEAEKETGIGSLTGAGTALDADYSDSEISDKSRSDAAERTVERVFDLDFDAIRRKADEEYLVDADGRNGGR